MLYWLTQLSDGGDFFNLFRYITFRAGGAFFTALLVGFIFGRPLINVLLRKQGKEISNMGHIIGGHGYNSLDLRYCKRSEIKREIFNSDTFISKFNSQKKFYAYANGGFNEYAIELLRNLNFVLPFEDN